MKEVIIGDSEPFSITFSDGNKWKKIQLEYREDVFKLASMFQLFLVENYIPFQVIKKEDNEPDSSILAN